MPVCKLELPSLALLMHSPLAIGSGFSRGLIDRAFLRAESGLAYVPGSVIKGKARSACEQVAAACNLGGCTSPSPNQMHAHCDGCLVCRIFGRPGQPATLRWRSAQLDSAWARALRPSARQRAPIGQSTVRTQVQIDRKLGQSAEAHLFSSEMAIPGLRFEARPAFNGWLDLTPMPGEEGIYYELVLLSAGLGLIQSIGGGHSRGTGFSEVALPENFLVDGQPVSIDRQLEYLEALELYQDEGR